jgi:predicted lipoprotein with Yx(FWY)xxD motif
MRYMPSRGLLALALALAFALVGCGANSSAGGYGVSGAATPTATASSHAGAGIVATASATVGGQTATILTDFAGRTLYYFDSDSATRSACAGSCASTWPPLIVSSGSPTSASALPGTLDASDVGNGQQVLYNGHPLYRYSGDAAPGNTNGDGIAGKWHVTTPTVAVNSGPSGPTPTPCKGYYCY